jgi:HEAT repeat protein
LLIYSFILGGGLVSGFAASILLLRLPEPPVAKEGAPGAQKATGTFVVNLRGALQRSAFRSFLLVLAVAFAVIAAVQPFLVVMFKQHYGQPDRVVALLLVVGSVGAIIMALLSGLAVDKLGPKPLIGIFAGVLTVTLIPLAIAPALATATAVLIFGAVIFLLFMLGMSGIASATNIYFFSIIRDSERLDMSVVYFLITGAAAAIGSLAGGAVLQALQNSVGDATAFRIYFGVMVLGTAAILPLARRLETSGSYGVRDALAVFFSIRDLRTLGLLNRLGKLKDAGAEQSVIAELGSTKSGLPRRDLLAKLHSPRFAVRFEALNALRHTRPHTDVDEAILSELRSHTYTTAYLAADIAGSRQIKQAIPLLRESLASREHFLVAKSMVALAKLGDRDSTKEIESLLRESKNALVIIHAATALELLGEVTSVPVLIGRLERRIAPYVRDELILSVAGIIGIGEYFYRAYTTFLAKGSAGIAELAALAGAKRDTEQLEEMLEALSSDRDRFIELAQELLAKVTIKKNRHDLRADLLNALAEPHLVQLDRLRFLVAAAIVWFAPHTATRGGR